MTRSFLAVCRMSWMDCRTWSSRLFITIRPSASGRSGKETPAPKNSLPIVESFALASFLTDHYCPGGDHRPRRQILWVITRVRLIAIARRRLPVDEDRRAPLDDGRAVGGRFDERAADRRVRRRVGRRAVHGCGGHPHNLHIAAQAAVNHPLELMWREHRVACRRLNLVHICRDDLIALLGRG